MSQLSCASASAPTASARPLLRAVCWDQDRRWANFRQLRLYRGARHGRRGPQRNPHEKVPPRFQVVVISASEHVSFVALRAPEVRSGSTSSVRSRVYRRELSLRVFGCLPVTARGAAWRQASEKPRRRKPRGEYAPAAVSVYGDLRRGSARLGHSRTELPA